MKILVVEDDHAIAQTLQLLFAGYNYAVDIAVDGDAGLQMADAFTYDLILLDVMLPKLDGISLCQRLRANGIQSPILLLTGQGGSHQKAIALNAGADDYVVKPFNTEELIARVQALLRRGGPTKPPILTWGDLSIDPSHLKVAYATHLLSVTPKEYAILELFLRSPQNVFSLRTILDHVWTSLESPGAEAVRVHIKELRQKLAAAGAPKDFIKTKHGIGYQLNPLYASSQEPKITDPLTTPQLAELRAVNEELRTTLEQLRSSQAALQQKNQELELAYHTLEQDRQQAEATLRESETTYRSLFNAIDEGCCIVKVLFDKTGKAYDYRFLETNLAFEQQPGLRAAIGKTSRTLELQHKGTWLEIYSEIARTGVPVRFKDFATAPGRFYDIHAFRIGEPHEQKVAILFNDITDRKQAELESRKFIALADHSADFIGMCDMNFVPFYINPAGKQMVGLNDIQQFKETPVREFFFPEDQDFIIHEFFPQILRSGRAEVEIRFRHFQTGEALWMIYSVICIRDDKDQPIALATISHNITERKRVETERQQAETALQESEQRLQAILDNSPAVIYLLDPQNRHLLVNRSYAELLSTTPENLVGRSIYEVWPTNLADAFAANNRTVLETGQRLQTEEVATLPDGRHTYITVKFPLCDVAGAPYAVCGISTDITEKKHLEAQFYRAQRLESLGTLASGIAHDLNNVLTPILTISQLLHMRHPNLDQRSLELLKLLEDSANRGANLVKQILTFTRGTGEERKPVQVIPVLQEVVNVIKQTFPKSIRIRQNIPEQSPGLVAADSTYLHQVLMNLCINARHAMPDGGTLTLSVEPCLVDHALAQTVLDAQIGNYIVITVADTGAGMPPEVRDRIFDPFFTTKPLGQGTGLGLATVLGIVKEYGGFLQVFSEVGQGTQIKVYLPAIEGSVTSSKETSSKETTPYNLRV